MLCAQSHRLCTITVQLPLRVRHMTFGWRFHVHAIEGVIDIFEDKDCFSSQYFGKLADCLEALRSFNPERYWVAGTLLRVESKDVTFESYDDNGNSTSQLASVNPADLSVIMPIDIDAALRTAIMQEVTTVRQSL